LSPWFLLASLSLSTFILTKLIVDFDFPPVLWLRDRVVGGWRPLTLAERADHRSDPSSAPAIQQIDGEPHRYLARKGWVPLFFAELMGCPWCVSGWISAATVAGTWAAAGLPVPVLYWLSAWALGALLAQRDW
jgi:hypothetical protein